MSPGRSLKRVLGITFGVAIGLGAMIGSGIMRTPALIAAEIPNSVVIIGLWVVGGLHAALGANIFAELATALPKAGGPYIYARRAFGDAAGLVVGWSDWLSNMASTAAASVSFAEFSALLWPAVQPHKVAVALILQLVLYSANIAGLREGRILQEATSLTKAAMLLVFVVAAIAVAPSAAAMSSAVASPAFGLGAVVVAYQMIVGAYAGWANPVTFSEENENPARSVPKALGLGLLITALLYIGVNGALVGVLGAEGLAQNALPFTAVLDRLGGSMPGILFAVGAMVTVASCANAAIMSGSRILFALSRDGLLPESISRVNKGGSPDTAFLFGALVSVMLAATGSFSIVFGLIGILVTMAGIVVESAFFALRRREPALERPFRARFHPWAPALLLAIDMSLLVLFARSDHVGIVFAFGLAAFCVPFAFVARRVKFRRQPAW